MIFQGASGRVHSSSVPAQAKLLRKGVDVVVATPGRLEDLIDDGSCE